MYTANTSRISSCSCTYYNSVLLILSIKAILKDWTDGMFPMHGAFKPHGPSGKESTQILEPGTKTKHLSIISHKPISILSLGIRTEQ